MDPMPWEPCDWPIPERFKQAELVMGESLDGFKVYLAAIVEAREWSRKRWRAQYPDRHEEIDAAVDQQLELVRLVRKEIEHLEQFLESSLLHHLLMLGMATQSVATSWARTAAVQIDIREQGREKATKANRKDWERLKSQAEAALMAIECEEQYKHAKREIVLTAAGQMMDPPCSASAMRAYLKGRPRRSSKPRKPAR
jgi:hypothetical protein